MRSQRFEPLFVSRLLIWVVLFSVFAGLPTMLQAAEGRWRLNHMQVQRPTPVQLGANCSFLGDGGRNGNIGGSQFETKCYSPTPGTTDVRAGNMSWHYLTSGFQPEPAGTFNEGLDVLLPGRLIGFSVDVAASTARATVSGQVRLSNTHPASGSLPIVATVYTAPQGKAAAKGHGSVPGKPRLLPNGGIPQLVLSFVLSGSHPSQGIRVHLFYDWVEDLGAVKPVPAPATAPAVPPTPVPQPPPTATPPADASAAASLGCFRDDRWNRDLKGFTFNEPGMTTGRCISACAQRGFKFAATQYSTHCFCDNAYGKFGAGTNCNMPCGGNKAEMCGGYSVNSVYPTGR